jgi:hypothetical protein
MCVHAHGSAGPWPSPALRVLLECASGFTLALCAGAWLSLWSQCAGAQRVARGCALSTRSEFHWPYPLEAGRGAALGLRKARRERCRPWGVTMQI